MKQRGMPRMRFRDEKGNHPGRNKISYAKRVMPLQNSTKWKWSPTAPTAAKRSPTFMPVAA